MEIDRVVQEYAQQAARAGHIDVVVGAAVGDRTSIAGDGRALFRIASLSKVFTGTALAVAVLRGELDLADRANDRLPPPMRLPSYDGTPIRLEHLATHRSGLPRGIAGTREDESAEELAAAIADLDLEAPPGAAYAYSNIGAALVGLLLADRAGRTYEAMLRTSVTEPLRLANVVEHPSAEQRTRLVTGHDETGAACHTPTYPLGVAAGGLYGTADDLLRFVRAHWAPSSNPELAAALRLATGPRAEALLDNRIGLYWLIGPPPEGNGPDAVWHNGALPGYRSFLALVPEREIAVTVLSNTALPIDGIGSTLLRTLVEAS